MGKTNSTRMLDNQEEKNFEPYNPFKSCNESKRFKDNNSQDSKSSCNKSLKKMLGNQILYSAYSEKPMRNNITGFKQSSAEELG
jgi:hypothetical protein